jgi:hypothetical protein
VDAYIAGAESLVDERIAWADARGLSHRVGATYRVPTAPWRVVWHTMEAPEDDPDTVPDEGWELDQTRAYIIAHRTPPHLWALPAHDAVFQTVPLTLASYALLHDWTGYPETNHQHAIQIEVLGWARDGLDDPELCDWLGHRVLRPVLDAGVSINEFRVAASTGADGAGVGGAVRFPDDYWASFNGQCGHANVPRNKHWDPGVADYLRIARAANQEDDMTPEQSAKLDQIHAAVFAGQPGQLPKQVWATEVAHLPTQTGSAADLLRRIRAEAGEDVDEAAVAAAVLAVLTPEAIAAAIPDELADQVADELAARLAG